MFRKYISLASSRIKHYAFHNALIFAMFMFGITISAIAFIFFYSGRAKLTFKCREFAATPSRKR